MDSYRWKEKLVPRTRLFLLTYFQELLWEATPYSTESTLITDNKCVSIRVEYTSSGTPLDKHFSRTLWERESFMPNVMKTLLRIDLKQIGLWIFLVTVSLRKRNICWMPFVTIIKNTIGEVAFHRLVGIRIQYNGSQAWYVWQMVCCKDLVEARVVLLNRTS